MTQRGIQVGDIVTLRSGGPAMVVRARSQNLAYCAWSSEGRHHDGTFEVGSLRRVSEPQQQAGTGPADAAGLPCA